MELIAPEIEVVLRESILPELEKGRKDFDRPHTEAVVFWMKELLEKIDSLTCDSQVLITAAYAHDWGYIGLFDGIDSSNIEVVHKMKPLHMERGSALITHLIEEKLSTYFTQKQKEEVARLVLMHDRIEELKTEPEILLMEADTLGMLDADKVKPTFSKADNEVFISRELQGRRLPAFIHPHAKTIALELAQKRLAFYEGK